MSLGRHIAIEVTKLGNTQQFYPDLGTALCITHATLHKALSPSYLSSKKQAIILLGTIQSFPYLLLIDFTRLWEK